MLNWLGQMKNIIYIIGHEERNNRIVRLMDDMPRSRVPIMHKGSTGMFLDLREPVLPVQSA